MTVFARVIVSLGGFAFMFNLPRLFLNPLKLSVVAISFAAVACVSSLNAAVAADDSASAKAADTASSKKAPATPTKGAYSDAAVKHYNRGVELHQAGFLSQAVGEYRAAIEADPRLEEAWSNLGGIYAAQHSYPKAVEAFEKALGINGNRPTTLNGYGTVLYARGKTAEAKEKWKQAFTIDPKFASAYYNMGNAVEGEKNIPGALQYYFKAVEANPDMSDAYYRIGSIFLKEKHNAQGRALLQRSLDLAPDADYAKEAKRQIAATDSLFAADKADKDLPPSVIAPRVQKTSVAAPEVVAPVTTKRVESSEKLPDSAIFDPFSKKNKKPKKNKKNDMVTQTPEPTQSAQATGQTTATETDLKEKPADF